MKYQKGKISEKKEIYLKVIYIIENRQMKKKVN